jgi:hypothetical protein
VDRLAVPFIPSCMTLDGERGTRSGRRAVFLQYCEIPSPNNE